MTPDREKVVNGLYDIGGFIAERVGFEQARNSLRTIDDTVALLKKQQQRIEALEIDRDILVKDINTNNCNTCKRQCEHRPEVGDVVRVNCIMWKGR